MKCSFTFSFLDQKAVPCCSTLARKFVIVVTVIAGRSEKMERLRERITWNWKFRELRFVLTLCWLIPQPFFSFSRRAIIQNNLLNFLISMLNTLRATVYLWMLCKNDEKFHFPLLELWRDFFLWKIGSQCHSAYVSSSLLLATSKSRHSSRSLLERSLSGW
jgi:hypothetical protein